MLIRNVDLNGQLVDVRLEAGHIAEIGTSLSGGSFVMGGRGGALIPGLHDHHIHLNASAAAMNSIPCGPPDILTRDALIKTLNQAGTGWLRGVGYHASVAGEIDRDWLDRYGPARPVRMQHRSGRLWILNSLAMEEMGFSSPEDGRIFDEDFTFKRGADFPDLNPLIARLLSYGITGVSEVSPKNGPKEYQHYIQKAQPLRLNIMGSEQLSADQSSHVKLHYHDHDLPPLDDLAAEISRAHKQGRNIAAHCVTRAELMLSLAALEMAGPLYGDRIEHAAIADDAAIEWMKKLDVIVVTQPHFIVERQQAYRIDVPQSDHKNLWRLKGFLEVGLKVSAGSDAPFGGLNPWAGMAAAMCRPDEFSPDGISQDSITPEQALDLYTKPASDAGARARKIGVGAQADLCLLDRSWALARENLAAVQVRATWIGGKIVYQSSSII